MSSLVLLSQFLSVHIPGVEAQPTLESTEVFDGWGDAVPLLSMKLYSSCLFNIFNTFHRLYLLFNSIQHHVTNHKPFAPSDQQHLTLTTCVYLKYSHINTPYCKNTKSFTHKVTSQNGSYTWLHSPGLYASCCQFFLSSLGNLDLWALLFQHVRYKNRNR